VQENQECWYSL